MVLQDNPPSANMHFDDLRVISERGEAVDYIDVSAKTWNY